MTRGKRRRLLSVEKRLVDRVISSRESGNSARHKISLQRLGRIFYVLHIEGKEGAL